MSPGTYRCIYHWWQKLIPAFIKVLSIPFTPQKAVPIDFGFQLFPWHDFKSFLTFQLFPCIILLYLPSLPVLCSCPHCGKGIIPQCMSNPLPFLQFYICTTTGFSCEFLGSWFPYYSAYFSEEAHLCNDYMSCDDAFLQVESYFTVLSWLTVYCSVIHELERICNWSWPNESTLLAFTWRDWGQTQKT